MTASIKALVAAGTLTFAATAPAAADYTILQDSSLPSVLFFEFDGGPAPKVIRASVDSDSSSQSLAVEDPALPSVAGDDDDGSANQNSGTSVEIEINDGPADDGPSGKTVDERIDEKINELENASQEELEDIVIDRAIEDELLSETELR